MWQRYSFRFRIFLFFVLMAVGSVALVLGALYAAYTRAAATVPADPFVFAGAISGFGLIALIVGIWFLFDENVARPVEKLATQLRLKAHAKVDAQIDTDAARYLGDLAPAAQAVTKQLSSSTLASAEEVAMQTAQLAMEKDRLTALLTEIPVAIMLINPRHQIVLYDGQAAEVLAQIHHPRLNASLFDFFRRDAFDVAYEQLNETGKEVAFTAQSGDGKLSFSARMKPLGDGAGYMLIVDDSAANIAPQAARPLVYDFDLLNANRDGDLRSRDLTDLTFVVFDTETTGLLPHKDEIVQIGALRVVNGRTVQGEEVEWYVDPGMPIPPASTKVHGISDRMVQGHPPIAEVGRTFHSYSADSVLVAHNAPFDMSFLKRHGPAMGVEWNHPILDTVLLSAVLFGVNEVHTLDALCDRLGLRIPAALRHTALGDARATAGCLVRMIPMLKARGMNTLDDVIAETRRHGRLLEDLN